MLPFKARQENLQLGLDDPGSPLGQRVLLFRLLIGNAQELRKRMDRRLAADGLTTQQVLVLHHLSAATEPPTLTQCAALLGMTHQNLKQIVLALERKQLVAMTVDAADARVRRLHLTARHRRLWKRRDPDDHSEVARWTSALSDAEVLALVALLDRLHADLAVAADEA